MGTPTGSQFWKVSNILKKKNQIDSPEILLQSANEYFDWCDKHSWHKQEPVKSGSDCGRIIQVPIKRPYSISGLCAYLGCNQKYLHKLKKKENNEFKRIIEHIENIIETQQFEGAVTGLFNTSIISRKLGLKEQSDITTSGETTFKIEVIEQKTLEQLNKLKERLRQEPIS